MIVEGASSHWLFLNQYFPYDKAILILAEKAEGRSKCFAHDLDNNVGHERRY